MKRLYTGAFFIVIFSFYLYIVYPGLKGGFVLDDFPNLSPLSIVNAQGDLQSFLFNGISSFLGRPLSLLSFALQAEHWPHNPEPFKWVGLLLHLVNAGLLYLCGALTVRILGGNKRAQLWIGLGICVFWLFLALHISTVFYVIQRMTLLSAMFSLAAIYGFLRGLALKNRRGLVYATIFITIGYIAGILAKENAILLGLYIAILYYFIRSHISLSEQYRKYWDYWITVFALAPPFCILGYLWITLPSNAFDFRSFSLSERLLTETIILIEYLCHIFFPTAQELNIFNDGYPVAKGLLFPSRASFALFAWLLVIIFSIKYRKRYPLFAFAVFWYLAGHSLESSFWPLELYFEHRNYLPSIGPITAIVIAVYYAVQNTRSNAGALFKKWFLLSILSVSILFNIFADSAEIQSWSSPGGLAIAALTDRPNSLRARQEAAAFFANTEDFATSTALLYSIEKDWPNTTGPYSQLRMLYCFDENIKLPPADELKQRLLLGGFDRITVDTWHQIFKFMVQNKCPNLTASKFQFYIQQLLANPGYNNKQDDLLILLAFSYNHEKKLTAASEALNQLPESRADLDYLILKAQFFAVAGKEQESLAILQRAEKRFRDDLRVWLPNKIRVEQINEMIRQKENPLN